MRVDRVHRPSEIGADGLSTLERQKSRCQNPYKGKHRGYSDTHERAQFTLASRDKEERLAYGTLQVSYGTSRKLPPDGVFQMHS